MSKIFCIFSLALFYTLPSHAQFTARDGRMYIETPDRTNYVEMYEGMTITLDENQSLPRAPEGFTWLSVRTSPSGFGRIYELVDVNDSRYTNSNFYHLLLFLDDIRYPDGAYTAKQRSSLISGALQEEGYSEDDAKTLAARLVDSKNKNRESEEIVRKFKRSKRGANKCGDTLLTKKRAV